MLVGLHREFQQKEMEMLGVQVSSLLTSVHQMTLRLEELNEQNTRLEAFVRTEINGVEQRAKEDVFRLQQMLSQFASVVEKAARASREALKMVHGSRNNVSVRTTKQDRSNDVGKAIEQLSQSLELIGQAQGDFQHWQEQQFQASQEKFLSWSRAQMNSKIEEMCQERIGIELQRRQSEENLQEKFAEHLQEKFAAATSSQHVQAENLVEQLRHDIQSRLGEQQFQSEGQLRRFCADLHGGVELEIRQQSESLQTELQQSLRKERQRLEELLEQSEQLAASKSQEMLQRQLKEVHMEFQEVSNQLQQSEKFESFVSELKAEVKSNSSEYIILRGEIHDLENLAAQSSNSQHSTEVQDSLKMQVQAAAQKQEGSIAVWLHSELQKGLEEERGHIKNMEVDISNQFHQRLQLEKSVVESLASELKAEMKAAAKSNSADHIILRGEVHDLQNSTAQSFHHVKTRFTHTEERERDNLQSTEQHLLSSQLEIRRHCNMMANELQDLKDALQRSNKVSTEEQRQSHAKLESTIAVQCDQQRQTCSTLSEQMELLLHRHRLLERRHEQLRMVSGWELQKPNTNQTYDTYPAGALTLAATKSTANTAERPQDSRTRNWMTLM
eukprot:gnl/MRDRNA2_/MRDRNA2_140122_c0_seq1.p1 gnl/MRDRNA2_/MRDRNA2_140122_c0~~gnl/MRDRNA2_/MRDRNA2_140122_c0_seq1.p1  ORF type:complete len:614 (+),score=172.12 gnl/MRDRNA2_/MRDRNA2_140122_c0_seq1:74-1915(+)